MQTYAKWSPRIVVRDFAEMQNVMLIASLDMKEDYSELVRNAPPGGELYERIRRRSLDA